MRKLRIVSALLLTSLLAAAFLSVPSRRAFASEPSSVERLEREVQDLRRTLADLRAEGKAPAEALDELERRISILVGEIESLKLGEAAPSAKDGTRGLGPAASKVYGIDRGVSIGGYGEMLFDDPDGTLQDGSPSGESAQLDLLRLVTYLGYKFNDRILLNSEIEYEHASTGEGDEERGEVAVEFAYLDFLIRDALNVRAGMLLVPVGFLNELHEPPIFLGSRRTLVEQAILPTTWSENGVGIYGERGAISYRTYLVTGLAAVEGTSSGAEGFGPGGIRDGRSHGSQAAAEDLAITGRLDWKPIEGLTVGGSFFTGNAGQGRTTSAGETFDARTTVWDAHVELRNRGLRARALYARTSIGDVALINEAQELEGSDSVGERQVGWYGEVGYDLFSHCQTDQSLIPFARHERWNTQDRVPSGFSADPANDVNATTVGVVWKPILNAAVKTDYSRIRNEARTGIDRFNLALGFLF